MASIFAQQKTFPALESEDAIEISDLLQCSEGVTKIIECMGSQFKLSKDDMLHNIKKIRTLYDADPERYRYLVTLLQEEQEKGTNTKDKSASVSGLWLKRALEFVCEFLWELITEHENCEKPYTKKSNASSVCTHNAYERTLKKHHNFIAKMAFMGAAKFVPYKEDLLKMLGLDTEGIEDQVVADMRAYAGPLKDFTHHLGVLYVRFGDKGPIIDAFKSGESQAQQQQKI